MGKIALSKDSFGDIMDKLKLHYSYNNYNCKYGFQKSAYLAKLTELPNLDVI